MRTGFPALAALLAVLLCSSSRPAVLEVAKADSCNSAGHRQFDFWLGTWEVHTLKRGLVGTNRITSILEGCALREEYEGKTGYRGISVNAYDRNRDRWHQTWIDNQGLLLQLDGRLEGNRMILLGPRLNEKRDTVWDRTTWEPLADGTVRQLWENAPGAAGPWAVVFDGNYHRKP